MQKSLFDTHSETAPAPAGFREVSEDQFFATVGQMDVHPRPVGPYPYTSHWKLRYGGTVGLSVSRENRNDDRYYVSVNDD